MIAQDSIRRTEPAKPSLAVGGYSSAKCSLLQFLDPSTNEPVSNTKTEVRRMRAWKQEDGSVYEEMDVKAFMRVETDSRGILDVGKLDPGRYLFKAGDLAGTVDVPAGEKLKDCTQKPVLKRMSSSKPHHRGHAKQ